MVKIWDVTKIINCVIIKSILITTLGCLVKTQTLNYSLNSNINLYLIIAKDTYDSLGLLLSDVVRIIDYFCLYLKAPDF